MRPSQAGDHIRDVAGPLGKPSEIKKFGTCVLVGGGVGTASLPIIARAVKAAGNRVIGIVGARNAGLLILEDEMSKPAMNSSSQLMTAAKDFTGLLPTSSSR